MRVDNSIRNIRVALIGQAISVMITFISRMVFINILGEAYLGLDGLFNNIVSILSLAEMGIVSAIVFSLYKPLALGEKKKVQVLMNFYALAYRVIGSIILVLGMLIVPFLDYLTKDQPAIHNIELIYLLFLINTVVSYFFAYKRSLIVADQKAYIATLYRYGFYIMCNLVQIVVLIKTQSFILFLIIKIVATIGENIAVTWQANKMYPFLKDRNKEKLDKETKREIVKNVKALMYHNIGGVLVTGTDNILIAKFVGVIWVGLYANYYLIISAIHTIVGQIFNAATASIGNLNATESKDKSYYIYKRMLFLNFWLAGFCAIALWELLNPFITLWIGEEYLFNGGLVFIIVINFFVGIVRKTTLIYKDAMGLFWNDRYKSLCEAIINIVASIVLALKLGIVGIFIGTFMSTMTTVFWVEPYVLYKYGFKMKVREYFFKYIKYTIAIIVAGVITHQICTVFTTVTWMSLFGRVAVCVLVPNLIFLGFFCRTDEFKYFWDLFKGIVGKVLIGKKLA